MKRAVAAALLFLACSDRVVTRDDWQRMNPDEKTLYVNSLLGAEKVRERKGGREHGVDAPAAEIVRRIDAAYAGGDMRSPEEIFVSLPAGATPPP